MKYDFSKIALIEPAVVAECLTTEVFAQIRSSLPFLAGSLKKHGIKSEIFCEELINLDKHLKIIAEKYSIIGISTTINTVQKACNIASKLKKYNKDLLIIFGGSLTSHYSKILHRFGNFTLTGRAEITLPLLLEHLSKKKNIQGVPNLTYLSNNVIKETESIPLHKDFPSDFSNIINFGRFSEKKNIIGIRKPPLYSIFTTTGCVNMCKFCVSDKIFNVRDLDNVFTDLETILEMHKTPVPPRIMIVDDCPFGDMDYFFEFLEKCGELRKKRNFSGMIQFHVKPLIKHKELPQLLKKAGINTLLLGLETISNETLKYENKGTTVEENLKAIEICRENNLTPYGYFVTGFDTDTETSIKELFDFILEKRLIAQVLPVGVMDDTSLDPYSFGATIKVSHRPANMTPLKLQELLIEGYDRIYSFKRILSLKSNRERIFQFFFAVSYRKWRKNLLNHCNYLKLLEKFS